MIRKRLPSAPIVTGPLTVRGASATRLLALYSSAGSELMFADQSGNITAPGLNATSTANANTVQTYGVNALTLRSQNSASASNVEVNTTGAWTGDLLTVKNNGTAKLTVSSEGALTIGPGGSPIVKVLTNTYSWDPTSLADGTQVTVDNTFAGAAVGDLVLCSHTSNVAGMILSGYVPSAGNVTTIMQNETGGAIDLDPGTLRVTIIKF